MSISSLIREAVHVMYRDARSEAEDVQALREAFGAWQGREVDGAGYVEGLRSGGRLHQAYAPEGGPLRTGRAPGGF